MASFKKRLMSWRKKTPVGAAKRGSQGSSPFGSLTSFNLDSKSPVLFSSEKMSKLQGMLGKVGVGNPLGKIGPDDFEPLKVIGQGTYGRVILVKRKSSDELFAMKVLNKDILKLLGQVKATQSERQILANLDHPFIVVLRWAFQTSQAVFMILDYIPGGELFFHLRTLKGKIFPESRARFYASNLVLAVEYLHENDVIHRDLKPENILVGADGYLVLTDFGFSKEVSGETSTLVGTRNYLAPEILQGKSYTNAVDWYSIGSLLYTMLVGRVPYASSSSATMFQNIINGKNLAWPKTGVSAEAKDLIKGLLHPDPKERLSAVAVKAHDFFKDLDWEAIQAKSVKPEWTPPIESPEDVSNFDPTFTNQSIDWKSLLSSPVLEHSESFSGFGFDKAKEGGSKRKGSKGSKRGKSSSSKK